MRPKLMLFLLIYWMVVYFGAIVASNYTEIDAKTFWAFGVLLPILLPLFASMYAISFVVYYGIKFIIYLAN